jgi:hypothetical protein
MHRRHHGKTPTSNQIMRVRRPTIFDEFDRMCVLREGVFAAPKQSKSSVVSALVFSSHDDVERIQDG